MSDSDLTIKEILVYAEFTLVFCTCGIRFNHLSRDQNPERLRIVKFMILLGSSSTLQPKILLHAYLLENKLLLNQI